MPRRTSSAAISSTSSIPRTARPRTGRCAKDGRRTAQHATSGLRLLTNDGQTRRYDLGFVYVSLDSVGLGRPGAPSSLLRDEGLGTQGVARDITELVLLREFSRNAELILPICSVCHKIRTGTGESIEWLPLAEYVERKTGVLFSHTYCPDHVPSF